MDFQKSLMVLQTTPSSDQPGKIRCAKISRGVSHPVIQNFEKVNVSSNGPYKWRNLSPMLMGPYKVIESIESNDVFRNGIYPGYTEYQTAQLSDRNPSEINPIATDKQSAVCLRFENFWQGGKIFALDYVLEVTRSSGDSFLATALIKDSFYQRRANMYRSEKGKRRALPKKKAGLPIYSLYFGVRMGYIESRKRVYCPLYAELCRRTTEYANLYQKVTFGENILIVGPDGRDIEMSEASLLQAIDDPSYIFGHELVIASLLSGYIPWLTAEERAIQETAPYPIIPTSEVGLINVY